MNQELWNYLSENGIKITPASVEHAEKLNRQLRDKEPTLAAQVEFVCGYVEPNNELRIEISKIELTLSDEEYKKAAKQACQACGLL